MGGNTQLICPLPRGHSRWYALRVQEGTAVSTADKLNWILGGTCLSRALALRKERWMKHQSSCP
ncbi:hypothetical protein [Paratractidigestivibacter sp.]|uniref:hypothetical protein n=1 Tax=Paratractidigestivibacter sp. TaxID=2847316 RepID=UPI002ACB10D6|nr:hypothetical protein [Paratractidigestivibacter sp.]